MSNVRFVSLNHATAPATVIVGTPPANAAFPAANALDPDRYTLWRTTDAPGAFQVVLDLGSAKSVACAALLNHTPLGAVGVVTCDVYSSTISSAGAWTLRGTISPAGAFDAKVTFGATSARWWFFDFTSVTGGFTLGKFLLGPVDDLGIKYAAGMARTRARVRSRETSLGGVPYVMELGRARWTWELLWPMRNKEATRAVLMALIELGTTFVLLDPDDAIYEVDFADDTLRDVHLWDTPPVHDVTTTLVQRP